MRLLLLDQPQPSSPLPEMQVALPLRLLALRAALQPELQRQGPLPEQPVPVAELLRVELVWTMLVLPLLELARVLLAQAEPPQ
jgi:hypothetical protein